MLRSKVRQRAVIVRYEDQCWSIKRRTQIVYVSECEFTCYSISRHQPSSRRVCGLGPVRLWSRCAGIFRYETMKLRIWNCGLKRIDICSIRCPPYRITSHSCPIVY